MSSSYSATPPRATHNSNATFTDPDRDSMFSTGLSDLFPSHFGIGTHPHESVHSYASSRLPEGQGDAVIPRLNEPHPYLLGPVNPRESRSFRKHAGSVLFEVPPANYLPAPKKSKAKGLQLPSLPKLEIPPQDPGYLSIGTYVTPYVNPNAIDFLNVHRPRTSVSYRARTESLPADPKWDRNRQVALDALEGRRPKNAEVSSFLDIESDNNKAQPTPPPVYPHSVLPASAYDSTTSDKDGAWQADEPATVKRQERTQTVKAQYTPEVVRVDGGSSKNASKNPEVGHRRGTHEVKQAPSQPITSRHPQVPKEIKVRKFLQRTDPSHSSWMPAKVLKDYHPSGDIGSQSYYFVEFIHPLYGKQEEWFVASRKEIKLASK